MDPGPKGIHSPSPYTFRLVDCMLILLHGQLCYFGSNGALGQGPLHGSCPRHSSQP